MLESFEKHKLLAEIWRDAISEYIDNMSLYAEKDEDNDEE